MMLQARSSSRRSDPFLPLVSVVVPSWRQGAFLRSCLDSLLAQRYPKVEILVRDNVSDDTTTEVLADLGPHLASVVREPDAGQSDALAKGFSQARGEILCWLNADDMLMPRSIERAVEVFLADPQADVVYGHLAFVDVHGQFLRYFAEVEPYSLHELVNYACFLPQPSTFFRRSAYEAVGGIDRGLRYAMDWDLWCRMGRAGKRFRFIPEVLAGARLHKDAKTAKGGLRRVIEIAQVNQRHSTTLLPILGLTQLYFAGPKSLVGPFHKPLGQLWRRLSGRTSAARAIVHGIDHEGRVVEDRFRVTLPVYRTLSGATLFVEGARGGVGGHPEVSLNGQAHSRSTETGAERTALDWDLPGDAPTQALVVEGHVSEGMAIPMRLDLRFHCV